jgi:type II secretory pathway pseudopilin PulG
LVELIVTMLIAVILIAITITFLTSGTTFLARTETGASDKALAQSAADFVKDQLLYASEVKVVYVDDGDGDGENPVPPDPSLAHGFTVLYIGNEDGSEITNTGHLYYKRPYGTGFVDILGDGMYKGKALALEYGAAVTTPGDGSPKAASFSVAARVVRDGSQTKEAAHTFRMYNIGLNSEPNESASAVSWDGSGPSDPGMNRKFYLLITPVTEDYVKAGLVMELSGVYNSIDERGNPVHDPTAAVWKDLSVLSDPIKATGTDMSLSADGAEVQEKWVSFDGASGYLKSTKALELTPYEQITIEICFRQRPGGASGFKILYEFSPAQFGEALYYAFPYASGKTQAELFMNVGNNPSINLDGIRNYLFARNPTRFTTHTLVYSRVKDDRGRLVFIDGAEQDFDERHSTVHNTVFLTEKSTVNNGQFPSRELYMAARSGYSLFFNGDIAAVRIYGRKLNPDEIAGNALIDQLHYN